PVLAEYCLPFVRVGGAFFAWKGMQYQEEAEEAKKAVVLLGGSGIEIKRVHLPGMEDVRAILCMKKTKPTPKAYPRKAGMPVKKPLGH
ncbi:MAG: class I SAM-dependent methyltransferase, partial [Selenomonadaceae bacterium]|nr:class I SAM-dependent methyltransferase [Selenomonadaceae bacterium]